MPLTNNQKSRALRERRAKLGQTRKEYYLTAEESCLVKEYIVSLREAKHEPTQEEK